MKAKYLDTNIFIRLIVGDVEDHLKKSQEIFRKIEAGEVKGLVSLLVVNEIVWILENFYELERKTYLPELLKLFALKNIKLIETNKQLVIKILKKMQHNSFDFTDVYLSELSNKSSIYSFDSDFKELFKDH